jgi:hypothetical protein
MEISLAGPRSTEDLFANLCGFASAFRMITPYLWDEYEVSQVEVFQESSVAFVP